MFANFQSVSDSVYIMTIKNMRGHFFHKKFKLREKKNIQKMISFRSVWFRFVSFDFVFVSLDFVFVSFRSVSFRFVFISFRTLQVPPEYSKTVHGI